MLATSPVTVRRISGEEHLDFIRAQRSVSFLQTPAWGQVKAEWEHESIGWFRDASSLGSSTHGSPDAELVGAGLVLYRQLPKVRRYLAYLPEGPVIDWADQDLDHWLAPMVAHLRRQGAFGVRMGPPVVTARWTAAQVKEGIAEEEVRRLGEVPPQVREVVGARVTSQLREAGWRPQSVEGGFAAGQPQHGFAIPLRHPDDTPVTEDELLKGMNQQWRRNIKKAAKEGVEVVRGSVEDLPLFHELYTHTAERDGFTPRPVSYFRTMFDALGGGARSDVAGGSARSAGSADGTDSPPATEIRLYLARHEGDLVAATIWIRVGAHTWYSYGASSTRKREVRGSNGIQWAMIRDSLAEGADVYDLRGITDTLDPDDSHVGLIQFKVGTGGEATEHAGEWDLPINRVIYKAFDLYMQRRAKGGS